jgi:hypothetical protein
MDEIRSRVGEREPAFRLGQTVIAHRQPHKAIGVIDAVFVDYAAALESRVVCDGWYEMQEVAPATPKTGLFWYSVILPGGAILQGELDLISGMEVSLLARAARAVLGGAP